MQYIGFIKRFLPFALTFVGGLLIASLFVPIGFGRFGGKHRHEQCQDVRGLEIRLERSENEVTRLRGELNRVKSESPVFDQDIGIEGELPLVPPPVAPTAPHRHR